MADEITYRDVQCVQVDQHRWSATIGLHHTDGTVTDIYACADDQHSGLWLGERVDHEEH